jgi:hypothetical protein
MKAEQSKSLEEKAMMGTRTQSKKLESNGQQEEQMSEKHPISELFEKQEIDLPFPGVYYDEVPTQLRWKVIRLRKDLARILLDRMHPDNRKEKPGKIRQYLREMNDDRWYISPEPLCISEEGPTVDGCNRLTAFLLSTREYIDVSICYNVPAECYPVLNTGQSRNVVDACRISGKPVSTRMASCCRAMMEGWKYSFSSSQGSNGEPRQIPTIQEQMDWLTAYSSGLQFVMDKMGANKRGVCPAGVQGMIARAYYSVSKFPPDGIDRLSKFCEIILTGLYDNKEIDSGAIKLRNWLMEISQQGTLSGSKGRDKPRGMIAGRTEYVLWNYLSKKKISTLLMPNKELFDLPPIKYEYSSEAK